ACRVSARVVEGNAYHAACCHRNGVMEMIGMVGVVVDLGFRRPGGATIIGKADINVGVSARWVFIKVADVQASGMRTAGRGHRRHRHRENAPALLRWNGDEERCGVDAKVGYDDRGTKRGRA